MKVIVIYGSPNDKPFMEPAREYFAQENVPYEETVLSAHRDLPELIRFTGPAWGIWKPAEKKRLSWLWPACPPPFPVWW